MPTEPSTRGPELLALMSSKIIETCRTELERHPIGLQASHVIADAEQVCLSMLQEMASLAEVIALLATRQDSWSACSACTALGRLPVEGLVYLNYVVQSPDREHAARLYVCSDIAWREFRLDSGVGRGWRRKHGAQEPHRPAAGRVAPLPVTKEESAEVDRLETESLGTAFDRVAAQADADVKQDIVAARPNATADVDMWRAAWNGLESLLKERGGRAKSEWQQQNGPWNRLKQWPCGLPPKKALADGRLLDQVESMFAAENPPEAADNVGRRLLVEWISDVGLDVMSNLAHFSLWRTLLDPSRFVSGTVATTFYVLFLAVRLPGLSYDWARRLRNTV